MNSSRVKESRRLARFEIRAPALLWPDETNPNRCVRTETKNVSRSGFYFLWTEFDRPIGSVIRFEVQLPSPLEGEGCRLCGYARVARYDIRESQRHGFATVVERVEMSAKMSSVAPVSSARRTIGLPAYSLRDSAKSGAPNR
jgi:hypothetical protein